MRLLFFLKCANIEYELQYVIFTVFIWKKKKKKVIIPGLSETNL